MKCPVKTRTLQFYRLGTLFTVTCTPVRKSFVSIGPPEGVFKNRHYHPCVSGTWPWSDFVDCYDGISVIVRYCPKEESCH